MAITFLQKVQTTIQTHQLLPPAGKGCKPVLVALSGGADSVALLRVLLELGYQCEAAHCNFQLRGAESERDAAFVAELCQDLGVKLHTCAFATREYAAQQHVSIEMAARDLRYEYFGQLAVQQNVECVAVAHHRDDNAETILLNLVRGTGLQGLTGMAYKRDLIVRPLLDVSRDEIVDFMDGLQQDYVTDSTNLEADVKRNVIRLKVMPVLRELNPSIEETLARNAAHLAEAQQMVQQQAATVETTVRPDGCIAVAKEQVKSHLILFQLLSPLGFTPSQIDDVWMRINETPGATYRSASHELIRDRNDLVIKELQSATILEAATLALGEPVAIGDQTLVASLISPSEIGGKLTNPDYAFLDADKLTLPLWVRPVQTADRFVPYGMKGSKLLSHYMRDHKFDLFQKQSQLVVVNGDDIVWLVGQRPDNRYAVDPKSTERVLQIKVDRA